MSRQIWLILLDRAGELNMPQCKWISTLLIRPTCKWNISHWFTPGAWNQQGTVPKGTGFWIGYFKKLEPEPNCPIPKDQ